MAEKKVSFEEALSKLEDCAEKLNKPDVSLEEAIKSFEDGLKHYEKASEILNDAKQKIEVYSK